MTLDTAIALAAIVLVLTWPIHQQLELRQLRYTLRQQHKLLRQHRRAIVQLQSTVAGQPTRTHEHMPVVGRSSECKSEPRNLHSGAANASRVASDPDPTLRLRRPPALDDIEATIVGAGRPLTRATISERLGRDVAAEIRDQLLAHTLRMVPTRDEAPAYWPASHPVPGDTLRMTRMPVLPGAA